MDLHEYQSKNIFNNYNILTPTGKVYFNINQINDIEKEIGFPCIVKAQIHSGARGKSGLIKKALNFKEVFEFSKWMFGNLVTTSQISDSRKINKILIEKIIEFKLEYYVSISINRSNGEILLTFSSKGGVEVEKNLKSDFCFELIDPFTGIKDFQLRNIIFSLPNISKKQFSNLFFFLKNLVKLFIELNANLVEVNPLVINSLDEVIALDAKISLDDNYVSNNLELSGLRDLSQENNLEQLARENDLSYVNLEGSIGCIVNGAGLAMATMDAIKNNGGEPANFLDIGGNCSKKKILEAFKIIILNKSVKSVLVNIFGGIVKCDIVSEGILEAKKNLNFSLPIVIRLNGTNRELAKQILMNSSFCKDFIFVETLSEAANKVINL